jgi:phage gp36-like protein
MSYCTYNDLLNFVDEVNLRQMVDDWAEGFDGVQTSNVLTTILQNASDQADAYVCSIYKTPFANPPQKLKQSAIAFAIEMLWRRRLTPEEKNPGKPLADMWRSIMVDIGAGKLPLDANFPREFPPVVASRSISPVNTNFF